RMDAPLKTSFVLTSFTSMRVVFCASNHTGSHTIASSAIAFFIFVLIFFIKHNRDEGCLCLYFIYLPYASITWIRFAKEFNSEKQIHFDGFNPIHIFDKIRTPPIDAAKIKEYSSLKKME